MEQAIDTSIARADRLNTTSCDGNLTISSSQINTSMGILSGLVASGPRVGWLVPDCIKERYLYLREYRGSKKGGDWLARGKHAS